MVSRVLSKESFERAVGSWKRPRPPKKEQISLPAGCPAVRGDSVVGERKSRFEKHEVNGSVWGRHAADLSVLVRRLQRIDTELELEFKSRDDAAGNVGESCDYEVSARGGLYRGDGAEVRDRCGYSGADGGRRSVGLVLPGRQKIGRPVTGQVLRRLRREDSSGEE